MKSIAACALMALSVLVVPFGTATADTRPGGYRSGPIYGYGPIVRETRIIERAVAVPAPVVVERRVYNYAAPVVRERRVYNYVAPVHTRRIYGYRAPVVAQRRVYNYVAAPVAPAPVVGPVYGYQSFVAGDDAWREPNRALGIYAPRNEQDTGETRRYFEAIKRQSGGD